MPLLGCEFEKVRKVFKSLVGSFFEIYKLGLFIRVKGQDGYGW